VTEDPKQQRRRGHVPDMPDVIQEGAAEQARPRRRGHLLERSRYALATTTGSAGAGGGSPPGDPPDEAGVFSLRHDNAGTERAGAIVLEDSDLTTITDKVADGGTDRAFDFSSVSLLLVGSLPGTGTAGILYHRTSDDTLHYDTGADGSWVQLALTSDVPAALWSKTGTDLSPATAGDDVLLNAGEILQLVESSDTATLSAWITGDTHPRLNLTAGGKLTLGSGSAAADVQLSRGGAHYLQLAAGDWLRLPTWLELAEISASGVAAPDSGFGRLLVEAARAYLLDDGGNLHELTIQGDSEVLGQWLADAASVTYDTDKTQNLPCAVTPITLYAYDWTNRKQQSGYAMWTWDAQRLQGLPDYAQAQLATGGQFHAAGCGKITVQAKVKYTCSVADGSAPSGGSYWDSVKLYCNSNDGASAALSGDLQSSLSNGNWRIIEYEFDISGWSLGAHDGIMAGLDFIGVAVDDPDPDPVNTWHYIAQIEWLRIVRRVN